MHSKRFARPVVITLHARSRMAERNISEAMLLDVIDTGDTRYRDETHLWAHKSFPERADDCCVPWWYWKTVGGQNRHAPFWIREG